MKQLSGQDNSFLEIERMGLPQHIGSVAIYDPSTAPGGKVRFKDILAFLQSRLHLSPIFRSKLQEVPMGLDRPYLIDDTAFDIEYHVRHIALPKPGDWRQLCILLARINARPLDLTRPLWEMYVIEGLDSIEGVSPGSFAMLLRIHHCVMDGASGVVMMSAIHDISPTPRTVEPEAAHIVHQPYSSTRMLGRAYLNALGKPKHIFQLGKKILGKQAENRNLPAEERHEAAKLEAVTRFNEQISPHRVLDMVRFDFADIRAIKNTQEDTTINDVMLAIVSGALHKYLKSEGELPSEPLVCGCPIDVRDDSERESGGNVIGLMGVKLESDIDDPLQRLRQVQDAANEAKVYAQASDVRINKEIMDTVPGGLMAAAVRVSSALGGHPTPFNVMLTNVPGPPNQLYFAGARIAMGFGIGVLVPGVGLFHTASSSVANKQGMITLSFYACRQMLPNPVFYRQCIIESFEELHNATVGASKSRTKPRKKAKAKK